MTGVFVCVVGPSGAGKDTLIDGARIELAEDGRFVFPRRLVTREASSAEGHDTLSTDEFRSRERRDDFALSWTAHGLGYAIPNSARLDLDDGRVVVCNISRGVIADARHRFEVVRVVLITAPRETLRERLMARGRESIALVDERLDREERQTMPRADLVINNVGSVGQSMDTLLLFLGSVAFDSSCQS